VEAGLEVGQSGGGGLGLEECEARGQSLQLVVAGRRGAGHGGVSASVSE
jgi:hypothetical protein